MEGNEQVRQRGAMAALEKRLADELAHARARFDSAKSNLDHASKAMSELGTTQPDGSYGVLKASREYASSLAEYHEALVRFSEFVLHGRTPEDLADFAS